MSITTHLNRRSALTVVIAVAMVALVAGLQVARPSKVQNQFAPSFKLVGEVGKPIQMREGKLTITGIRLAKSLETAGFSKEKIPTSAYWLLVDYKFFQERESESMTVELYTADNTRYTASLRPSSVNAKTSIYSEPGFESSGIVAFEVPKAGLPGSKVVIGNGALYGLPLWDHQAVVPLGIDEARANRLVESAPAVIVLGG